MPQYLEDTRGFFVVTPWDEEHEPEYADKFVAACHNTGVPVEEIPVQEALRREPALNRRISRVFEVQDGAADSFFAAYGVANAARQHGAQVLTYHHVTRMIREKDRVAAAVVDDLRTGEQKRIEASYIINATGAWAGKVAALAGVRVNVVPGKGTMIAMNHRMVNTVINRCKYPHDGDILVPIHTVAVIGTTDIHVPDPDIFSITADEVSFLMEEGEKLVTNFAHYRALRAWAGVRPLYKEEKEVASDRDISRAYKLLDHEQRDGVRGLISIVGGKWTTYRLMAEHLVDLVAEKLNVTTPCRTQEEIIPDPEGESQMYWLGHNLAHVEADDSYGDLICECEMVTRKQVLHSITHSGAANIDDIRRETRLGMGPCQGGFCAYRAAALWHEVRQGEPAGNGNGKAVAAQTEHSSNALLLHFLQERWKGLTAIMWGDQLRQARLDQLIYLDTLGIDLLPEPLTRKQPSADDLMTGHPAIATEYHSS
jgi:glycerol-3-phosphate dehydrogenase